MFFLAPQDQFTRGREDARTRKKRYVFASSLLSEARGRSAQPLFFLLEGPLTLTTPSSHTLPLPPPPPAYECCSSLFFFSFPSLVPPPFFLFFFLHVKRKRKRVAKEKKETHFLHGPFLRSWPAKPIFFAWTIPAKLASEADFF